MADHKCPKCKQETFSWYVDQEIAEITIWTCSNCDLQIYEDDRDEIYCKECEDNTTTFLKNEDEEFWWCSICNTTTNKK